MKDLSLILICKNETQDLINLFESIKGIDCDIHVAFNGDSKETEDILKRYGANIHPWVWTNSFAEARTYALSFSTTPYFFWLDADDTVSDVQAFNRNFEKMKAENADVMYINYHYEHDEAGFASVIIGRERVLKASNAKWVVNKTDMSDCLEPVEGKWESFYAKDFFINHNMQSKSDSERAERNLSMTEAAYKNKTSPKASMYYAQALKLNHRLNESIPYFIEGLADNEKDQEHQLYIYGELITALIDIKRYDEALDWCDKAEKDFPTIGLWSFKRCRLYVILEQWGKVIECFEKGFELEMPDETFIAIYPREWDYYPNLSYALALSKLGRYEQACQVIMSTLERYQKDVHLTELLKECLINIKNNMQERKLQ